jgi:hypothetical protein
MLCRTLATLHPSYAAPYFFCYNSILEGFLLVALVELSHVGRVPVHDEALQQDLVETVWDIRDKDHLAVVG